MKNVIIYSTNTWPHCVTAKEYLSGKGIKYTEKNVQSDTEARKELLAMGYRGVPVIVVDGEEIVGFDKGRLDQLLP